MLDSCRLPRAIIEQYCHVSWGAGNRRNESLSKHAGEKLEASLSACKVLNDMGCREDLSVITS